MSDWTSKEAIEKWWSSPSQQHIKRPYTAEDVLELRDVIQEYEAGNKFAIILRDLLSRKSNAKDFSLAMSATDAVSIQMMAEVGLDTATIDPSTDLADYTYDTVPRKVTTLVRSQLLHARTAQACKRAPTPLVPIIADADSGHGLSTATMKLVKLFVQAGTAGIHIDDLLSGAKRFDGKDGIGNIIVPVSEHVRRLTAAKLQLDVMGSEMVLIQRTDSETATHITSTIDPRDRPFILGATSKSLRDLSSMSTSQSIHEWLAAANVKTLDEAFFATSPEQASSFTEKTVGMNVSEALRVAQELNPAFYWSAEACRTTQGWYRYRGGVQAAIVRSLACSDISDVSWSCVMTCNVKDAETFSRAIQSAHPGRWMAFNVTGAFNLPPDAIGLGARAAASSVKEGDVLGYIQNVSRPAEKAMPSTSVEWWWKTMGRLTDVAGDAIGTGL